MMIQAIGAPFPTHFSSCSDKTPTQFQWTTSDQPIKVFIDGAIFQNFGYQKKPEEKKIAWICESRSIFYAAYIPQIEWERHLKIVSEQYDIVFVSDRKYVGGFPNIKYAPAGSNLPWIKNQGIFPKTKLTSMIASPKQITFGQELRHRFAEKYKTKIDLYGGVLGSKRLNGDIMWGDKSEGLNDYMFSLTLENDKYTTYYTEKITDCFATGTIPVYWGSPDIGDYFNKDGIIEIISTFDIETLTSDLYYSKLDAVKDNFERVKKLQSSDDKLYELIHEH